MKLAHIAFFAVALTIILLVENSIAMRGIPDNDDINANRTHYHKFTYSVDWPLSPSARQSIETDRKWEKDLSELNARFKKRTEELEAAAKVVPQIWWIPNRFVTPPPANVPTFQAGLRDDGTIVWRKVP